jgi:hypothetical protein
VKGRRIGRIGCNRGFPPISAGQMVGDSTKRRKAMKSILYAGAIGLGSIMVPAAAGGAGILYDCDTAADHFSELALPAGSIPFSVSGKVQLNAIAPSKKFAAVARIQIASAAAPGQSPAAFAGFSLSALPADAQKTPSGAAAVQMLSYNVKGKDDDILPLSMTDRLGTAQPFTLAYDGSAVSVTLGNETRSFPVKIAEPAVRIVCSTGEFLITDLTIAPAH